MNMEMALKSRSFILDLDHVKLSLGIFILLGCLMESLLLQVLEYRGKPGVSTNLVQT